MTATLRPTIKGRSKEMSLYRLKLRAQGALGFISMLLFSAMAFAETEDITAIPFESLVKTEIITATKIGQQISNAPSAVSIITAEDIEKFGYRTMADIISSLRGLYTTYDRTYTYMGGRGFGRTGDYAGRVMLLIDGYQANDNLYNSAYLGNDGLLDVELIDRVEYVSGPGGTTYGNGAFYGIINVITKKGADIHGLQAGASVGSFGTQKQRLTYGKTLDNGLQVLLSTSRLSSDGQTLFYPEFDTADNNHGRAQHLDDERNRRYFGKLMFGAWTLSGAFVNRQKSDPTAQYGADFNLSPNWVRDRNGYIDLRFDDDISNTLKATFRSYYGHYQYQSLTPYSGEISSEKDLGKWWGAEAKFTNTSHAQHKLLYGMEYRNDFHQDFRVAQTSSSNTQYLISGYLQDEYHWQDDIKLNIGARYDYGDKNASYLSPRLAAIYALNAETDLKISYASAFRRPNAYEKYYAAPDAQEPNQSLKIETVNATEAVIETRPDTQTRILCSLFHYDTHHTISASEINHTGVIQYVNLGETTTRGADFELDHAWKSGQRLRTSYAWHRSEDSNGKWQINSPEHLFKTNLSIPLLINKVHLGIESQTFGPRLTEDRNKIGGYSVVNVTVSALHLMQNVRISATVRNLFNQDYAIAASAFNTQDTIPQDGRNFWLQMVYQWP